MRRVVQTKDSHCPNPGHHSFGAIWKGKGLYCEWCDAFIRYRHPKPKALKWSGGLIQSGACVECGCSRAPFDKLECIC